MTKVEKDAIRARVAKYWDAYNDNHYDLLDIGGLLAVGAEKLLAALEEAEAQIFGHCEAAHELGRLHADMIVDRDRWKARAEALERALREDGTCVTCAYVAKGTLEEPCRTCDRGQGNFYNWQFDEARFSKQEDTK